MLPWAVVGYRAGKHVWLSLCGEACVLHLGRYRVAVLLRAAPRECGLSTPHTVLFPAYTVTLVQGGHLGAHQHNTHRGVSALHVLLVCGHVTNSGLLLWSRGWDPYTCDPP